MSARQKPQPDPEAAQVYETSRGVMMQILYVDESVFLTRTDDERRNGDNAHRIGRRTEFDKNIEYGKFELRPDSDLDMMDFSEIDWSKVDYIGKISNTNLHNAGFDTALDIQQAEDHELLAVDGVGQTGLENLREFAQ